SWSKTPSPASKREAPAGSGSSSPSTGANRVPNWPLPAPMPSRPTSPNCFSRTRIPPPPCPRLRRMSGRPRTDLPPDVYPNDPWALVEESFAPRFVYLTETIFALSNGFLGIRGTVDEGAPVHLHGTYIN